MLSLEEFYFHMYMLLLLMLWTGSWRSASLVLFCWITKVILGHDTLAATMVVVLVHI